MEVYGGTSAVPSVSMLLLMSLELLLENIIMISSQGMADALVSRCSYVPIRVHWLLLEICLTLG